MRIAILSADAMIAICKLHFIPLMAYKLIWSQMCSLTNLNNNLDMNYSWNVIDMIHPLFFGSFCMGFGFPKYEAGHYLANISSIS